MKFLAPMSDGGRLDFVAKPTVGNLSCDIIPDPESASYTAGSSVRLIANPQGGSTKPGGSTNYSYKWYEATDSNESPLGTGREYNKTYYYPGILRMALEVKDENSPSSTPAKCYQDVTITEPLPSLPMTCGLDSYGNWQVYNAPSGATFSWFGTNNLTGSARSIPAVDTGGGLYNSQIIVAGVTVNSVLGNTTLFCGVRKLDNNGLVHDYGISDDGDKTVIAGASTNSIVTVDASDPATGTSIITPLIKRIGEYFVRVYVDWINLGTGNADIKNIIGTGVGESFSPDKILTENTNTLTLQTYGGTPPNVYYVKLRSEPTNPPNGYYCLMSSPETIINNPKYSRAYYACAPNPITIDEVVQLYKDKYVFSTEIIYDNITRQILNNLDTSGRVTGGLTLDNFLTDFNNYPMYAVTPERIADFICPDHTWQTTIASPGRFSCNGPLFPLQSSMSYDINSVSDFTLTVTANPYKPPTLTAYPATCGNGQISLSWNNPGGGATSYSVFKKDLLPGTLTLLTNTTNTTYTYTGTPSYLYGFVVKANYPDGSQSLESNAQNIFAPYGCSCAPEKDIIIRDVANKWNAKYGTTGTPLLDPTLYNFSWTAPQYGSSVLSTNPFTHNGFTTDGVKNVSVRVTSKAYPSSFANVACSVGTVVPPFDYSLSNTGDVSLRPGQTINGPDIRVRADSGTQRLITLQLIEQPTDISTTFTNGASVTATNPYTSSPTRISVGSSVKPGTYLVKVSGDYVTTTPSDDSTAFYVSVLCADNTLTCTVPPPTVSAVRPTVREKGKGKIAVNFTPVSDPTVTYEMERVLSSSATYNPSDPSYSKTNPTKSFDDSGLNQGIDYKYKAVSLKGGQRSIEVEKISTASKVGNASMSLSGYQDIVNYLDTTNVNADFKLVGGVSDCTLSSYPPRTQWNNKTFLAQSDAPINDTATGDDGSGYKNITGPWTTPPLTEDQELRARCTRIENGVPVPFIADPEVVICVRPQKPQNLEAKYSATGNRVA
ncbi:MAG: hypothetical protein KBC06_03025, partial [Candidatus Pacebacteria bacterium]|nr:hypothetical protein [Candidatus Paceibacterota bacterium]